MYFTEFNFSFIVKPINSINFYIRTYKHVYFYRKTLSDFELSKDFIRNFIR